MSGLIVKAVNVDTGTTRSVKANADGTYRLPKLPSGNYRVSVVKGDTILKQSNYRVALGANTVANFDMTGKNTEVINVVGTNVSMIDVGSSDSGLTLGSVEINKMPVARNITAVALLAPGVVKGSSDFGNTASFGGSSVAENACYINGLEVTNTRKGLGCGEVPFEFYKEFQVKTGGYSAKFGRATGGTINSITKSGTNEWKFAATAHFTPNGLRSAGQASRGNGGTGHVFRDSRLDASQTSEFTLSVGGPIIKDKLFIYALVNPRDVTSSFTNNISTYGQYKPNNIYADRKASMKDNTFWGTKIDWDIDENNRLSYFGYSNRSNTTETDYAYNGDTNRARSYFDLTKQ